MIEVSNHGGSESRSPAATALPADATDLFLPERELRDHRVLVRAGLLALDTIALALPMAWLIRDVCRCFVAVRRFLVRNRTAHPDYFGLAA